MISYSVFVESHGRLLQMVIVGQSAAVFWADHAVKEVKVIDLRFAGH